MHKHIDFPSWAGEMQQAKVDKKNSKSPISIKDSSYKRDQRQQSRADRGNKKTKQSVENRASRTKTDKADRTGHTKRGQDRTA